MKGLSGTEILKRATLLLSLAAVLAYGQAPGRQSVPVTQNHAIQTEQNEPPAQVDAAAE